MQKSFASSWTMIDGKTNSSHQVSPMTLESNLVISCFWTSSQRVRRLSQLWKLNLTGTSLRRPGRQLWRSFQVREFQVTPPKTDMEPEYHLFEKEHHPPSTSILGFHVKKFSWMYSFCRFQFLCLSLQRSSKELLGLLGLQKLPKVFGGVAIEHFEFRKACFHILPAEFGIASTMHPHLFRTWGTTQYSKHLYPSSELTNRYKNSTWALFSKSLHIFFQKTK